MKNQNQNPTYYVVTKHKTYGPWSYHEGPFDTHDHARDRKLYADLKDYFNYSLYKVITSNEFDEIEE
jgi:hypothetical protein